MLVGSGEHPQVKTDKNGKKGYIYPWADSASQVINYVSAHDNMTLWDKIMVSHKDEDIDTLIKMNKFSMAIVFMSQGIPFIHAGDEILRSKKNSKCKLGFDDNSYRSNDNVNSIKWNDKTNYKEVFEYYKGLIAFRKDNELLKMIDRSEINKKIRFEEPKEGIIICKIKDDADRETMINVFNGTNKDYIVDLPSKKEWKLYVDDSRAGNDVIKIVKDKLEVKALSVASVINS
jgi:pullulanase